MKPIYAVLWLATLAGAFGAGRYLAPAAHELEDFTTIEAFRSALDERDWLVRAYGISAFLNGLDPDNIEPAIEAVEAKRRWLSQDEMRLFMIAWAGFDPAGALERVLTWPDRTRTRGASAAIYAWTLRDPAAAREALNSIDETQLKENLLDRMVSAWGRSGDYAGVTEYVSAMPPGRTRGRFATILAHQIMESGFDALIAWAESIPEDSPAEFQRTVIRKTSGVFVQEDPLRAAAWVEGHDGRPYEGEGARVVAKEWASRDPTAALEWAMGLPKKAIREASVSAAFTRWFREKPEEAETWLMAAAPTPTLDGSHRILLQRKLAASPESALAIAERIQDEAGRNRSLIMAVRSWRKSDEAAADAWLSESGLSEEMKSKILKVPKKRK